MTTAPPKPTETKSQGVKVYAAIVTLLLALSVTGNIMLLLPARNAEEAGPGAAAGTPSSQDKMLQVKIYARVDGSDEVKITPSELSWNHLTYQWPTSTSINDMAMDPHD